MKPDKINYIVLHAYLSKNIVDTELLDTGDIIPRDWRNGEASAVSIPEGDPVWRSRGGQAWSCVISPSPGNDLVAELGCNFPQSSRSPVPAVPVNRGQNCCAPLKALLRCRSSDVSVAVPLLKCSQSFQSPSGVRVLKPQRDCRGNFMIFPREGPLVRLQARICLFSGGPGALRAASVEAPALIGPRAREPSRSHANVRDRHAGLT
ncbi:hypothetical protein FQR65_LT19929 [Abscondita terminalis]|nr:hypothetical protein FQR65_LT19929 [Abscondita terminalis]